MHFAILHNWNIQENEQQNNMHIISSRNKITNHYLILHILTVMFGLQFTISVHNVNNSLEALSKYFQCVALGNYYCDDERKALEEASVPELTLVFSC